MSIRFSLFFLLLLPVVLSAQTIVRGRIVNADEQPLSGVSVTILGSSRQTISSDSGSFNLTVTPNRAFALVFTLQGYRTYQQNFLLNTNEEEFVVVRLEAGKPDLEEVIIRDQRDRTESGLIRPNPRSAINLPSPVMGVEGLLKIIVGSNNELTSQYNVRGGNYDENLVYVNDFEIFRPYLVRSGQQEGLSFINPQLVRNISFYNGGFQAKYGDKISSVLDIQYRKPQQFGGSAYVSLLEQGVHLEGASKKFTWLVGARNRSNQNLLSRQETQGNYVPSSSDIQALFTWEISQRLHAEFLGNYSRTRFSLKPSYSQLTSSVFSPFFTANLGVDIYFEGNERDEYETQMAGISLTQQVNSKLKLKWLASLFSNREAENIDISGAYLFGDRDFDRSSSTYGLITNPLGAGINLNYSRNRLDINNINLSHKGYYDKGKHAWSWGLGFDRTHIEDNLNEFEYQDSAGYSLPYTPGSLSLNKVTRSSNILDVNKLNAFVQDNIIWHKGNATYTFTTGIRFNYNSLNNQFLVQPRFNASFKPGWKRDVIFRAAAGTYHQPPFYRELRRYDGTLNTMVEAQRSSQYVLGADYNFVGFGRPLRLTSEVYFKWLTHTVPYDIDNVRIRYSGLNQATAYAAGVEARLYGEVVKDAESWLSLGLMRTREDIENDFYTKYTRDGSGNVVDSQRVQNGWLRRPSDRLITIGMFFQDYLSTNKNFKVYLSTIYGSNLPYNIPGSVQYRNALTIPAYLRMDIGFSALLLPEDRAARRAHSPFRDFENIWATLELFNMIDRSNTISYMLIKDFQNNIFTLPNRLTPRLVNLKLVARW